MAYCQITKRTLHHNRVPIGQDPVFELDLESNQEIVSWYHNSTGGPDRKTEDHFAVVWVLTRIDVPAGEGDDAR